MDTSYQFHDAIGLLAAIVMSSEDAVISETLDGIITSWNLAAEKLFGYNATEAIGTPISLIIPHEKFIEEQHIIRELRSGKTIAHYETVRITKNSRKIDISLTMSPIRDLTGKIVGASNIARDITTRKEQEAQATSAQLRAICLQLIGENEQSFIMPSPPPSPREVEILKWCAQGKTLEVIGTILGISKKTVDYHITAIYRKLQVNNRTSAVLKAISLNILTA